MTIQKNEIKHHLSLATTTTLHWKIWFLSAMGIFLEGYDLFVIGIALPLINQDFHPSAMLQGFIASSAVFGMIFGASLGGKITDRFGRRSIFIIDLFLFFIFTILSSFASNALYLIIFRFLLGIGLGADYPICASYISEIMPAKIRGKMLISAFSFQALGMIFASIVGLFVLSLDQNTNSWRIMLASGAIPSVIIMFLRRNVFESPLWLISKGKIQDALKIISKLTATSIEVLEQKINNENKKSDHPVYGHKILFSKDYIKQTFLASTPWFLMDVASYAVGIFTPILISKLIIQKPSGAISEIYRSISGAAFVDLFLVIGFIFNILLIEKLGRIKLQIIGFLGMTVGLILLLTSLFFDHKDSSLHTVFIFTGFTIFNFLLNLGPNATTFTIAAEVYPTQIRASGHGFAAAFAKFGAFLGIFLMPIITQKYGLDISLIFLTSFCFLGMIITIIAGEETKGKVLL